VIWTVLHIIHQNTHRITSADAVFTIARVTCSLRTVCDRCFHDTTTSRHNAALNSTLSDCATSTTTMRRLDARHTTFSNDSTATPQRTSPFNIKNKTVTLGQNTPPINKMPFTANLYGDDTKAVSDLRALQRLVALRDAHIAATPAGNFDSDLTPKIKIHSGSVSPDGISGSAKFSLAFSKAYINIQHGGVHGGAIATFLDNAMNCSVAVLAIPGTGRWQHGGLTKGLMISYMKPTKAGEEVVVDVEIVCASAKVATVRGTMKSAKDGHVLAVCGMEKVAVEKIEKCKAMGECDEMFEMPAKAKL